MDDKRYLSACSIILFVLFTIVLPLSTCARKNLGLPVPDGAPVVKLSDIMDAPDNFNGKKVVLKGIVSAQCPSLCEFTYKEGTTTTLIFPRGFKFPKLETGKPVTVYAEITSGTGQVVVTALGLRRE